MKQHDILLYGDVGWEDGITDKGFARSLAQVPGDVDVVNLRINTLGGSSGEGLAIFNLAKAFSQKRTLGNPKFELNTVVDGYAYSAGSLIYMAGKKRYMNIGTMLMIHKAWLFAAGNSDELETVVAYLRKIDDSMSDVYADRTGKAKADMMDVMKAETFFSASESLSAGFSTQESTEEAPAKAKSLWDDQTQLAVASFGTKRGNYTRFMEGRFATKAMALPPEKRTVEGNRYVLASMALMELESGLLAG